MHGAFGNPAAVTKEIGGQFRQGTDKIVSRNFGRVAKLLWPLKTAAHLAVIAKTNERTAARWLSGEFEPPYCVIEATMREIFSRD